MPIPGDTEKGDSIHIILRIRDDGEPNLFSYKRIVIAVDPDAETSLTVSRHAPRVRAKTSVAWTGERFDIRGVRVAGRRGEHSTMNSIAGGSVPSGIYIVRRAWSRGGQFFTTVKGVANSQEIK